MSPTSCGSTTRETWLRWLTLRMRSGRLEAKLLEAVTMARAHERSWGRIGIALGVSRQAARQRFADQVGD